MSRNTTRTLGRLAIASVLMFVVATPAKASLLIGFVFQDGSSAVGVPFYGGAYTIDVVATSDDPNVIDLGIRQVYWGAISSGNLGIDGKVTDQDMSSSLLAAGGTNGDISDINADGHVDLGPAANTSANSRGPSGTHPWWVVAGNGSTLVDDGTPWVLLGTFTVTIPANGNPGEFLRYTPNLQASSIVNYDSWSENGANVTGKYSTDPGAHNVNIGVSASYLDPPDGTVTFVVVPEPAGFVLTALGGLALFACRRRRRDCWFESPVQVNCHAEKSAATKSTLE